jgi:phosphoribosylanthranilate isomerase
MMIQRKLKLKVCGMRDADNIRQLATLEPDYIGFIFYPNSKRYATNLDLALLRSLPSSIKKTGVFVDSTYQDITEKIEMYQLNAVQLHGAETPELCMKINELGIEVIKAFGIDNNFDFNILSEYNKGVDYFLFDTKTKEHGGSGKVFDWELLNQYTLDKPYFLSGGLSTDNIAEIKSIPDTRLYALDLNSRFELEPGLKDIKKLTAVFNEIKVPG